MISFNIRCANEHVFEVWFNNSTAYEEQSASGEVACPICGDSTVEKAPMAPRVNMGTSRPSATNVPPVVAIREMITEIHRHVSENTEDVGGNFAEEARRIHYGETEERGIRGEASDDEVQKLEEEDIDVYRLPNLPRSDA
jgi:hypothetical protein